MTCLSESVVVICSPDSPWRHRAELFSHDQQLRLIDSESSLDLNKSLKNDFALALDYNSGVAEVRQFGKGAPGPVSASFLNGSVQHRQKFGGGRGQMLARAVGLKSGITPGVLDATAGLARDAFVLATLGCQVKMLERSPWVRELLHTALGQGKEDAELVSLVSRMSLVETDAIHWLRDQPGAVADVIYLDPMYPHRDKSAQVKKEMKLFQKMVGQDQDDTELLAVALEKARYRVVVKRPRKAKSIADRAPGLQISGKSCRYDIYPIKSLEALRNSAS